MCGVGNRTLMKEPTSFDICGNTPQERSHP